MAVNIGIISGEGGVGKTTTSINLGMALNHFGYDVTVVDANLSTPNVGVYLGVSKVPVHLHHALLGKKNIQEAVYSHHSGTKIVPASISISHIGNYGVDSLRKALVDLDKVTDVVLIDGAAGLGNETMATVNASDKIIVVTNPELPAITDALKTIKLCDKLRKEVIGVVVSRYGRKQDVSIENIKAMLEVPIIGIIPRDVAIKDALRMNDSVVITHPMSDSSIGFKKLAANLLGVEYEPSYEQPVSFWKRIFKK